MAVFKAESMRDLAKFLRRQAMEAGTKMKALARCKSKKYFEGQQHAYNNLAGMIEHGELELCTCGADRTGPSAEAHDVDCPCAARFSANAEDDREALGGGYK